MINIESISTSKPYSYFVNLYKKAVQADQKVVEAIAISSFDSQNIEVESRFVNLKYILDEEWIFFSNYDSPKAKQFKMHDQITALFFWNSINVQIRIKATIKKSNEELSNQHYISRSKEKNALAHSSSQSKQIESYDKVLNNYKITLNNEELISQRPKNWGGFSFEPYYFEFWEGSIHRLNKREVFTKNKKNWIKSFLQP